MATNKENAMNAIRAKKTNPVLLYFKRNTGIIIGLVLLTALFTIFTNNFLTISNGGWVILFSQLDIVVFPTLQKVPISSCVRLRSLRNSFNLSPNR